METLTYIEEQYLISEMIYSFAKKVNRMLKENNIIAWMYDQESFTGASHYLNTKLGKIRVSDHSRPAKAFIYSEPHKSVVVNLDSKEELNDLFDYIQSNINILF